MLHKFSISQISLQDMQPRYAHHARNLTSPVEFSTSDNLETCSIDSGDQTL